MHAAVVHSFDAPPRYDTVPDPVASGEHQVLVDVLAAGLHPRVRSAADGSHYTSDGTLPLVPGIDAVGRTPDGELLYFVAADSAPGTMAERAVVDRRRAVALPAGTDPAAVAAAMNPGMSSWVALRRRVSFRPGGTVLVMGATGNAGQLAVRIARHLGAARVIGAGRDPGRLALLKGLGADEVVALDGDDRDVADRLGRAAADADVVLDYLWGPPAVLAMTALLTARSDRAKAMAWIQIGSMAGQEIALPSFLLRAGNLNIMGSGQGSLTTAGILAELPSLAQEIAAGTLAVDVLPVPLDQVEQAWNTPVDPGRRVVLTP
ncbi:zinc-binding alcohol dehydrogenase family protein [Streptomyces sp. NBC_00338]|uniref:quinone oxidoreductase family protein n=1 Tax=unclassified Streptomyces TaxID=2593676 RepID=UPI00224D4390|nr:zinc-binding alcohol dehydrogenase family protein [Streptomyces sp. NBC_00338]MCX5144016.1 zinc-binding alcohol dehydrogenase family protein [Streptomyces sp. NBC_00338]WSU62360.1 zinc-binding alcohol dehydrogenase family protein [Streptomyces sp. NBC_01104]